MPSLRVLALSGLVVLSTSVSTGAQQRLGGEFQVNVYTTGSQSFPAVAKDAQDNFVVVWESYGQDGSSEGIFGQRFEADGNPIGGEFQVNTYTTGSQRYPEVAAGDEGNFVVVWQSDAQDGDSGGIFGQRYDALGNPAGGEFQVNIYTTAAQTSVDVSADADGDLVVVWEGEGQGDDVGIFGQRFSALGGRIGGEMQIGFGPAYAEQAPSVASAATGGFVVAWEIALAGSEHVVGQSYDDSGAVLGTFLISGCCSDERSPRVAADSVGNFVVAWESEEYLGGYGYNGILGRSFDPAGRATNSFQVDLSKSAVSPGISSDAAGNFTVVWQHEEVLGRAYDSSATPRAAEFVINSYQTGLQHLPAVDSAPDGDFVAIWVSDEQDGDSSGVFGQRYAAPGLRLTVDSGTCPGEAAVSVSNAPSGSEVALVSAANTNGFVKGGALCPGTELEIGEPFALPPTFVIVDGQGNGVAELQLPAARCWLQALDLADCRTSNTVQVPSGAGNG